MASSSAAVETTILMCESCFRWRSTSWGLNTDEFFNLLRWEAWKLLNDPAAVLTVWNEAGNHAISEMKWKKWYLQYLESAESETLINSKCVEIFGLSQHNKSRALSHCNVLNKSGSGAWKIFKSDCEKCKKSSPWVSWIANDATRDDDSYYWSFITEVWI